MLAGLIFATEEAEDQPDMLAATLPFGGMTLLEYQVRLLIGAGAGHIMVAVARVTPALLAAIARAGRKGVPIDLVRSAAEAAEHVHPVARVLVVADGLVTTDTIMARMAADGPEALLVTNDAHCPAALERLDAEHCWAGLARVPAERLVELARWPSDYDFQSTLLRIVAQSDPVAIVLSAGAIRSGHAVERQASALASRGNVVLAALTERRVTWVDRFVFTRIARVLLPRLVERGVPTWLIGGGGLLVSAGALGLMGFGMTGPGLLVSLVAVALFAVGAAMRALAGEEKRARGHEHAIGLLSALAMLVTGWWAGHSPDAPIGVALALALVAVAAIAERVPTPHHRWWASPAGNLLLLTPFALAGFTTVGLGALLGYALASLASAVEALREQP